MPGQEADINVPAKGGAPDRDHEEANQRKAEHAKDTILEKEPEYNPDELVRFRARTHVPRWPGPAVRRSRRPAAG